MLDYGYNTLISNKLNDSIERVEMSYFKTRSNLFLRAVSLVVTIAFLSTNTVLAHPKYIFEASKLAPSSVFQKGETSAENNEKIRKVKMTRSDLKILEAIDDLIKEGMPLLNAR